MRPHLPKQYLLTAEYHLKGASVQVTYDGQLAPPPQLFEAIGRALDEVTDTTDEQPAPAWRGRQ